jgi:PAS domain S-box-containing protein
MSAPHTDLAEAAKLRLDAEARLKAGSAPATSGWSVGVSALGLLHKLASTPENAVDALKLLHELQVHQVELDLQNEHMESAQRELAEELVRYRGLYEYAPVGYLNVSAQRDILESNIAAAGLLGTGRDELRGFNLDAFLAPASRPVISRMLTRLHPGGPGGACEVQLHVGRASRKLRILASVTPGGGSFLLILVDLTDIRKSDERI